MYRDILVIHICIPISLAMLHYLKETSGSRFAKVFIGFFMAAFVLLMIVVLLGVIKTIVRFDKYKHYKN